MKKGKKGGERIKKGKRRGRRGWERGREHREKERNENFFPFLSGREGETMSSLSESYTLSYW